MEIFTIKNRKSVGFGGVRDEIIPDLGFNIENKKDIKTCLECPKSKVINDPDPYDWFNDDDMAVVCGIKLKTENDLKKIKLGSKWLSDKQPYKIVTTACRPYNLKKESIIPDEWCPLQPLNDKLTAEKRTEMMTRYSIVTDKYGEVKEIIFKEL